MPDDPSEMGLICFVISLIARRPRLHRHRGGAGSLARILFGLFLIVAIVIVVIAFAVGQVVF